MATGFDSEKEVLAQKIARLELKEKLIREKERKLKLKRLLELGDIVAKAEIDHLDVETLLGAFLEIKALSAKEERVEKWKAFGKESLDIDKVLNPQPLIVSFESELPMNIKIALRQKKFRWNQFRREWYGYGKKDDIEEFLKGQKANVEIAQVRG